MDRNDNNTSTIEIIKNNKIWTKWKIFHFIQILLYSNS